VCVGAAASRSMFIALLSTICCVISSARENTHRRHSAARLLARSSHFRSCFFFGVCQKTEFFTLRRNKAQVRVHTLNPEILSVFGTHATRTYIRLLALLSVCRLVRNQRLAINEQNHFLVPKMNP